MADWHLALRALPRCRIARSSAMLDYRMHDGNWSAQGRGRDQKRMRGNIRRDASRLTVATVYSGRLGQPFFYTWIGAIRNNLREAGKVAELIVMDDSADGCPPVDMRDTFDCVKVIRVHRGRAAVERRLARYDCAEFLSSAFNRVLDESGGNLIWTVEDDIIPPDHACRAMLETLCMEPSLAAVAGYYRSRFTANTFVASHVRKKVDYLESIPEGLHPVDFTGTGCLMLARPMIGGARFGIEWHSGRFHSSGHDWNFSWKLKQLGRPINMMPDVFCKHYQTPTEFL